VQNEEVVFYHSVGAVQELSKQLSELVDATEYNERRIAELNADWRQLELVTSSSLSNSTELALRRTAADAAIAKNNMEMELLRFRSEKEYAQVQEELEAEQLAKSERMALDRLKREDEASKRRTTELMRAKFEASQRIAAHRSHVRATCHPLLTEITPDASRLSAYLFRRPRRSLESSTSRRSYYSGLQKK